jgi:hypothetical protein
MGLSTKGTGGTGQSKLIEPGNTMAKILKFELDQPSFLVKDQGYYLNLHLEGPDLGPEFEGFFIDKDNESLGRHAGKVGKVKANQYAYKDGVTKGGTPVFRDNDIIKAIGNILKEMGVNDWMDKMDGKFETIEELIAGLNQDMPFAEKMLNFCIAGRQYVKQNGYTANDCYLPKWSKFALPYESITASPSKLAKFDPEIHLQQPKPVEGFSGDDEDDATPPPSAGAQDISDFDI